MVCYLAAVAYLCFARLENMNDMALFILGIPADKVAHFLMFLPFPVLMLLCYDKFSVRPSQAVFFALLGIIAGEALAGFTELMQGRLGYRTADIFDFIADSLGILAGAAAALVIDIRQMRSSR